MHNATATATATANAKTRYDVVIVGAGHAGAQAAIALRQQQFAGSIAIVGDEPELPYERPPLSKDYLSGEKQFERLLIRPETFWSERQITLLTGREVDMVDPSDKKIIADDGSVIVFDKLIWAAGGRPRRLSCPGRDLRGVHSVRRRDDVDQILAELPGAERVVVIGAGYIGLETTAVLTKLGKAVTVLEAQDRVLARVAGRTISQFYLDQHLGHGVDLRLATQVASIEGHDGRVAGVRLATGEIIPCGMVIVGIGIVPSIDALIAAGVGYQHQNGVRIDAFCQTSMPDIYAIGDCALHVNRFANGSEIRLESVGNANDMAATVARTIVGLPAVHDAVPWFWSNQYDLRLQTVGLSMGHDEEIVRGDPATRSFSVVYLRQGRVVALDCVNAAKDYAQGRRLVEHHAELPRQWLADPNHPLKLVVPEGVAPS